MPTVHKTNDAAEFDQGLNCILSDLTEDRYGDVVGDGTHPMLGWDLAEFNRNPIALFNHQSSFPIGTWKNLRVENGALVGRLHMAPKGSSPRIDELKALLSAGVLRGISVGFIPVEHKQRDTGGYHYLRQKLVEASLVSVPANPAALLTAKTLGVSKQTIAMVFKSEQDEFMEQCISDLEGEGVEDAEQVCQIIWQERRLEHALKARANAMAEVKRIDDQIASEYSWEEQIRRQREQTIANWTRHALKHRDPPKQPHDPVNAPYGTWRGVKLPGPTWRGKPIR
jgi:HK97 family phage prohead protease